jgi:hypothetical protein
MKSPLIGQSQWLAHVPIFNGVTRKYCSKFMFMGGVWKHLCIYWILILAQMRVTMGMLFYVTWNSIYKQWNILQSAYNSFTKYFFQKEVHVYKKNTGMHYFCYSLRRSNIKPFPWLIKSNKKLTYHLIHYEITYNKACYKFLIVNTLKLM